MKRVLTSVAIFVLFLTPLAWAHTYPQCLRDEAWALEAIKSGSGVTSGLDSSDLTTINDEVTLGGTDYTGGQQMTGCYWTLGPYKDIDQSCDSPGACDVGAPINPATGTMYHDEVDIYVDGGLLPLIVSRRYSAGPARDMPFRKNANWFYPEYASVSDSASSYSDGFNPDTFCQSYLTSGSSPHILRSCFASIWGCR